MKCLMMRTIVIFYFVLIVKALDTERISIDNYLPLIVDVHKYYYTSCVIFVHHDNYQDLNITTMVHTWSREFSRRGVMTVTSTFLSLVTDYKYYKNIVQPLFVILLDSKESIDEFANATRNLRSMSSPAWLVLFLQFSGPSFKTTCRHPVDNIFNVNFNTKMLVLCYDQPVLTEWYAVNDNHTRTSELATWSADKGLILIKQKSFYSRRDNLFGKVVRVAFVYEPPFTFLKNGTIAGLLGALILELSKTMNFKMQLLDPMELYGSWDQQQKLWTGVIGQLVTGQADIGIGMFSMMPHRLDVIDFTLPLMYSRNHLYLKQLDDSKVYWLAYLKAFDFGIWAIILTIIMCFPILLIIIKAKRYISLNSIMENYTNVWGIFCQQGLPKFPDETPMRLAIFSIFIASLVIQAAYSASSISFLTHPVFNLPFSTVEGYIADGSYKLIVTKDSAEYDLFYTAKNPILVKMNATMKEKEQLPLGLTNAFQQICKEKNIAFYTTGANNVVEVHCKIVSIETAETDSMAMILQKGSPYTGIINYHIRRFLDHGVLNRMKKNYLSIVNLPEAKHNEVDLDDVVPLLVMVAGGMILGIFILMLEKAYYVFKIRRKNGFIKKPSDKFDVKLRWRNTRKNLWLQRFYGIHYGRTIGHWP